MTKEQLNDLINDNDEKEYIEFKVNYPADKYFEEIGEYISALSNSAAYHKQENAYMIWGVEDKTRKIVGTAFHYDIEINGSEVFKHYLARNLEPRIALKFKDYIINDNRIVCLTIPAAKEVITEFNRERFIRIGSSKERLRKFPKYEAELWATLSGSDDITKIPSDRKILTFQILKNYLSVNKYHFNDFTFEDNLHLRCEDGRYNLMAELLADENNISVNVATFVGNDKSEYLRRNEFGNKCLLLAMEQAKNYIESINQTFVDTTVRPRREKKMFDMDAFMEAWYNACVHNRWDKSQNPGIYVYSDRLEIESYGGIPKSLSKAQFLKGKSRPVNERLFEICKACHFVEESGHGVPKVTTTYGEDAYIFTVNFINVVIPFDRTGFSGTTQEKLKTTQETTQEKLKTTKKTTQEKIVELLKANPSLTRKDLAIVLNVSEDGIKYHLNTLKNKGIIQHQGSTKSGYWIVNDDKK